VGSGSIGLSKKGLAFGRTGGGALVIQVVFPDLKRERWLWIHIFTTGFQRIVAALLNAAV